MAKRDQSNSLIDLSGPYSSGSGSYASGNWSCFSGISIEHCLLEIASLFSKKGIGTPQLSARILVKSVTSYEEAGLITHARRILTKSEGKRLAEYVSRHLNHEPIAYILGSKEFWDASFLVNSDTLIPRPDSETLIDVIQQLYSDCPPQNILDMGTGSGCLLLTLLQIFPKAKGTGVDISHGALQVAEKNAEKLELKERVHWIEGSWFDQVHGRFDLILSNPPYISTKEMTELDANVAKFEPKLALEGGISGLEAYECIIPRLQSFLRPNSYSVVEVGHLQSDQVSDIFNKNDFFDIQGHTDLGGQVRVVSARNTTSIF